MEKRRKGNTGNRGEEEGCLRDEKKGRKRGKVLEL